MFESSIPIWRISPLCSRRSRRWSVWSTGIPWIRARDQRWRALEALVRRTVHRLEPWRLPCIWNKNMILLKRFFGNITQINKKILALMEEYKYFLISHSNIASILVVAQYIPIRIVREALLTKPWIKTHILFSSYFKIQSKYTRYLSN